MQPRVEKLRRRKLDGLIDALDEKARELLAVRRATSTTRAAASNGARRRRRSTPSKQAAASSGITQVDRAS